MPKNKTKSEILIELEQAHKRIAELETVGKTTGQSVEVDIAERTQTEEAQRERDERYQLLFEGMTQGVVFQDGEGRLLHANPAAEKIMGLTLEEMRGQKAIDPDWPIIQQDGSALPADEHPSMRVLRNGQPVNNIVIGVFNPQKKIYIWLNINAFPRFNNGDSRPYQVFTIFEDITAHKKIELELRESEQQLRSMLEVSQAMSASLEMDTVLQKIIENATGLLQLDSGAIYTLEDDQLFLEATTPPLPPGFPDELRRANVTDHPHIKTAISSGSAVVLADTTMAELSNAEKMAAEARGLRSIMYVPLIISEKAIGVFIVASVNRLRTFREEEIAMYSGFSGQAAQTIVNTRLYNSEREYAAKLEMQIAERMQAEERLHDSEERLSQIADNVGEVVWMFDNREQKLVYLNAAYEKIWGRSIEETYQNSQNYIDAIHPEDRGIMFAALERQGQGERTEMEYRVVHSNGSIFWISDRSFPIYGEDGALIRTTGIATDITERKRAEYDLHESERKYHDLINGMNDTVWVIDTDMSFLDLNDAAVKMLGYSRNELLLMKVSDIDDAIEPEQIQALINRLNEEKLQVFETRHKAKNGRVIPVEVSSSLVSYMGRTVIMSIARDITERKQFEIALVSSEKKLKSLVDSQTHFVIRVNMQGNYTYWNSRFEKEFGWIYQTSDFRNTPVMTAVCPHHHERVRQVVEKCIFQPGQVFSVEIDKPARDGGVRTTLWEFVCLTDENNQPVEIQCMGIEITERKRIEQQLLDTERYYRAMIENAPDGIVLVSADGKFKFTSPAVEKITGYNSLEIQQQDPVQMTHPDQLTLVIGELEKVIRDPSYKPIIQYRFLNKSGEWRWVESTFSNLLDLLGMEAIIINVRDINERKQAEEALARSQALLAEAQRIGRIGHMEWMGIGGGLVCSDELYDILELPRGITITKQVIGRMLLPGEEERIHALEMQSIQMRTDMDYEYRILTESGKEKWLHQIGKTTYGEDGQPVRMMFIVQDITERKRTEEKLRSEQTRLAKLADTIPGAILTFQLTPDGLLGIPYASKAFEDIYGIPQKDVRENINAIIDRVPADQVEQLLQAVQESMATMQPWRREYEYYHPQKGRIWLEGMSMPVKEADDTILWHGVTSDITERKREELYTQAVLRLTNVSYSVTDMNDLIRAMLDEAEELTDSAVGFFHFVDNDQNTIKLQAWSTNTLMNLCTAEGHGQHYPVEQAGVWADAVRSGEAQIYNDYPSLEHRKGLPAGHAPIARLITLPVKRNDLVVAALGIGNKVQEYIDQDLEVLQRLADTVFDIIMRKRVEETLRNNEERLRTVADFTYDMEFWMDENKTLLYMSPSCQRITGYEREQLQKDPSLLQSMVHPDDRSVFEKHSIEEFDLPDSCSLDFRIVTASGEVRWISHTCQAVTGANGKFRGRRVSHRDITEPRHTLQELRASEEKYRGLVKSLSTAISVLDFSGNFLYLNDTAAEDFASTPQEVIGRNMHDLFPEPFASAQMTYVQRVFKTDQEIEYEAQSMVEGGLRWFRVSFQPLHDENGEVKQVLINATDIHDLKAAQQELQELNRTLEEKVAQRTTEVQDLYENAPTGYHSIDVEGKFVMVNQTELNRLGYTREEMIGHAAVDFITEATREAFQESFLLLIQRGWVKDVELEFARKDGSALPILLNATAVYDEAGNFIVTRSTIFDNTERKQAENELKRNINFTSALLNAVPTPVFYKDKEGRYLGCNHVFVELMGKTPEEIRGKLPHEVWETTQADLYRQKDLELMQANQRQFYEAVITDKNGVVRPVIFVKDLFYDEDGNVAGLVGAFIDISERKQAENAIRESEATYRALFENSNDGIFLMSSTGEELRANQRALDMVGYTLEEYLTLGHINQNPFTSEADQRKDADDKLDALLRGETVPLYERIFTAKDGHKVPVEINLSPVRDANGTIIMVQSVVRDIAERKAAEEALRSINKELERALLVKDEFLANMSHELRTPLNGILGFSEILLSGQFGSLSERQHKYVSSIESSGKHLLGLINDLLDLAKIEAGKLDVTLENVVISELCQSSLMFVKQIALNKSIQLSFEQDMTYPYLIADQRRLKQILVNLLSNAVKFTPEHGKVTLRVIADPVKDCVDFAVEDTGIGISQEDLLRLFKPFTQVDSSLTRQHEGTGLGLALVQKLAELHGGGITVQSEVGKGSTFTVCIPGRNTISLEEQKEKMIIPEPVVPTRQGGARFGKILLAEDTESNIVILGDYLEHQGYQLIYAKNGQEALEKAKETLPDLILMDIQMPVMDGLEATRRLRADPRFATLPIIALTALAMTGDRERCLEAGATEYVSKPMNLKKLTEMIANLLKVKA